MGIEFTHPTRIEQAYRKAISEVVSTWLPQMPQGLDPEEWIQRLTLLAHNDEISNLSASVAARMVRWVNVENAKTWREASARSQKSRMLYRLLERELKGSVGTRINQLTHENAQLIRSIPTKVAEILTREVAKAQQQGTRPETIAKMIRQQFPRHTESRIKLIARTETAKASTALTRARSEELDLPFFIWRTSADQRVRPSHRTMNGIVVGWSDPPSPEALIGEKSSLGHYAPGNCPNCRCTPLVILTLEDIYGRGSIARVYANGRIATMTRAQFAHMSGIESRLAA